MLNSEMYVIIVHVERRSVHACAVDRIASIEREHTVVAGKCVTELHVYYFCQQITPLSLVLLEDGLMRVLLYLTTVTHLPLTPTARVQLPVALSSLTLQVIIQKHMAYRYGFTWIWNMA